ncbi:MAG: hypothetical protein GY941_12290 [Planctomycetes bacterium]|nr:hypothetical protein [Planctomycetota bacterium]
MAENNIKPLLDISTEKQDNYIQIDNAKYDLTDFDSFSVIQRREILRLGQTLKTTANIESDEDEASGHQTLNKIFGFIMPNVKADILNKLSITKKQDILGIYLESSGLLKKNVEMETQEDQ